MSAQLLQSLVPCVASQTGVRVTGLEGTGYPVMGPIAATLSFPRHPQADSSADPDHRAAGSYERASGKRAGRLVSAAGGAASTTVVRTAAGTVLADRFPMWRTTKLALGGFGRSHKPAGDKFNPGKPASNAWRLRRNLSAN